ncbi:uncharacterized protein F5Z01DRAFT_740703 [Emericellopsis atlantica]|uniref:Chromo domain-containing protein n=1 Tax=Emericellopsis atlantica TaxID=2614577 RepID=A0A9P8CLE0_9HYPO|nr:uncharacterized protein F5Z01DRAFT_740703 [Emericellopsis atlantica]KAG9249511.1 hypothetical protein F5Z01DRAFT_740703 [Emericellopsis atlantica]
MPQREEIVGPPNRRSKRKTAVSGSNEVQHDNFFAKEIQRHKINENVCLGHGDLLASITDYKQGSIELLVQWEDSNGTSLRTWEVEDRLEDSPALEEYFVRLGGRERLFKKQVRRGLRRRNSDSPLVPARRSPRSKTAALAKSTEWSPPERS